MFVGNFCLLKKADDDNDGRLFNVSRDCFYCQDRKIYIHYPSQFSYSDRNHLIKQYRSSWPGKT